MIQTPSQLFRFILSSSLALLAFEIAGTIHPPQTDSSFDILSFLPYALRVREWINLSVSHETHGKKRKGPFLRQSALAAPQCGGLEYSGLPRWEQEAVDLRL
jgi:hypothetical protein